MLSKLLLLVFAFVGYRINEYCTFILLLLKEEYNNCIFISPFLCLTKVHYVYATKNKDRMGGNNKQIDRVVKCFDSNLLFIIYTLLIFINLYIRIIMMTWYGLLYLDIQLQHPNYQEKSLLLNLFLEL